MNGFEEVIEAHAFARQHGIHIVYGYSTDMGGKWVAPFATAQVLLEQLKKVAGVPDRFENNEVVWYINAKDKPQKDVIVDVDSCSPEKYLLKDADIWMHESELYKSEHELIEVQLKHWTSLRSDAQERQHILDAKKYYAGFGYKQTCTDNYEISTGDELLVENDCVHQHDGNVYTSNPPMNRCCKCGEFYR